MEILEITKMEHVGTLRLLEIRNCEHEGILEITENPRWQSCCISDTKIPKGHFTSGTKPSPSHFIEFDEDGCE
jgi:hypothetical protein